MFIVLIHTCMHTYIHTYIHAYIHTYIQTDRQTYNTLIQYITLHYITLHCIAVQCSTVHYTTVRDITYIHSYILSYQIIIHDIRLRILFIAIVRHRPIVMGIQFPTKQLRQFQKYVDFKMGSYITSPQKKVKWNLKNIPPLEKGKQSSTLQIHQVWGSKNFFYFFSEVFFKRSFSLSFFRGSAGFQCRLICGFIYGCFFGRSIPN